MGEHQWFGPCGVCQGLRRRGCRVSQEHLVGGDRAGYRAIRVPWRPALGAALLASVAWELARRGFVWYLGSGWASYDVAYGSLGVVVALLFWIYLSGWIVLFGAHLCAAMTRLEAGDPGPETR